MALQGPRSLKLAKSSPFCTSNLTDVHPRPNRPRHRDAGTGQSCAGSKSAPPPKIGEVLTRLVGAVERNHKPLAKLIALKGGKPVVDARAEVEETVWTADRMAQLAPNAGEAELLYDPFRHGWLGFLRQRPYRTVGAITGASFPLLMPVLGVLPGALRGQPRRSQTGERDRGRGSGIASAVAGIRRRRAAIYHPGRSGKRVRPRIVRQPRN